MNQLQTYIHQSRYARWIESENRRETWNETVSRYISFFEERTPEAKKVLPELKQAILDMKIMPSMRAFMTAGKALEKDEVAGYNCSFIAVDDVRAFDEAMYISMCGTGVGFSVERQFVSQLPTVAEAMHKTDTVIKVKDSKIGWASSFRELLSLLYSGQVPSWDVSAVRPAGAPLKTFGGRASGPAPLENLFNFCIQVFNRAVGRKLSSLECHDIMCKVADVVVSGGVRRSAMISLSNLSDDRMRNAKNGQWWETEPQRALSNNSAAYTEKPEIGIFMKEWLTLYESHSGERGIFNRVAAKEQCRKTGRRDDSHDFGTNPCVTGDTWVMTNIGPRQVLDLNTPYIARVNGKDYQSTEFWSTGIKKVFNVMTDRGFEVKATDNHKFLVERSRKRNTRTGEITSKTEWVELKDIKKGDKIVLNNQRNSEWTGEGTFEEGWLLGEIVGDGGYNPNQYPTYVRFWGEDRKALADKAQSITRELPYDKHRPVLMGINSPKENDYNKTKSVTSRALDNLCVLDLDEEKVPLIAPKSKDLLPQLEKMSSNFVRGFLRGFFDADGSVQGNTEKGVSVRLSQSDLDKLKVVQRMLQRLGIISDIYTNRRESGNRYLPDGKGGKKKYLCKANHELVISRDNLDIFQQVVGFNESEKSDKLEKILASRLKSAYRETFTTTVMDIIPFGEEETFDCTVQEVHCFDGNGMTLHNCGEIILRSKQFCNLTEVVVRNEDTADELIEKVKLASILGTLQSTMTNFRYLRKEWKKNCEEERLLGVSMTGLMDHPMMSKNNDKLKDLLTKLRETAIETNKTWADKLGINQSAAITCVKPSGTVSQLVDSASGIHPRYAQHYIRRVRADQKDPLGAMMQAQGVPYEPDVTKPDSVDVFSFFVKSPKGCVLRNDMDAIEQLELYLTYKNYWCEHNPSITVYVREHEWMKVGAWVYEHFNDIGGVSFLPHSDSGHVYAQAPYEEIDEKKFKELLPSMPAIDWSKLKEFELVDSTVSTKELACSAGSCEII